MRGLGASDVLRAWEVGRDRHAVDRALLLIGMAEPNLPEEALFALPVGERDARLVEARLRTFGDRFEALVSCPRCAAALEFSFHASAIQGEAPDEGGNAPFEAEVGGRRLLFRQPDSHDLAAIAGVADAAEARRELLRRCLVVAEGADPCLDVEQLTTALGKRVAQLLAERDPRADVELEVRCESCGHSWPVVFDIVAFFWAEIEALARSLLREVATLARAFGWHEADILAMSPARRRLYLKGAP